MIELLLNAESQLALGLLDQAERTYRTVLEADPRNGIAAVGLSRVALERGDEVGAHALAQAALEIDPENATARRMIQRLDEVARFRDATTSGHGGEATPAPPLDDETASRAAIPGLSAAETGGDPGPVPVPGPEPAPPTDAAYQAAPARPGLLRRILRRS